MPHAPRSGRIFPEALAFTCSYHSCMRLRNGTRRAHGANSTHRHDSRGSALRRDTTPTGHGGFPSPFSAYFFAGPHVAWALKVSASHHHPKTACEHAPRSPRELVYALVPASKSACVELSQSLCARALAFASFEPMPSAWQILPCDLHGGMRSPRQVATAGRMTIRPNMPERRRQWPPGPSA